SWAALAAVRTGPSAEVHARALTFARELATVRARTRRGDWPDRLFGRDPRKPSRMRWQKAKRVSPASCNRTHLALDWRGRVDDGTTQRALGAIWQVLGSYSRCPAHAGAERYRSSDYPSAS
ncbi:MAG: hypothetical protein WBP81_39450, partial [Solirubrobacteraceae bacterium]